jgi:O-antigen/teichoic acid export membrane protein
VVSYLLGPSDAGSLRLIKSLASLFSMVGESIGQVIFPEMARLVSAGEMALTTFLRRLLPALLALAAVGYIGYALAGPILIQFLFGDSYAEIYGPSLLYLVGSALGIVAVPLTPLLLVRGQQRALFVAYLIAGTAYLSAIVFGAQLAGIYGVGSALPALYAAYLLTIGSLHWFGKH